MRLPHSGLRPAPAGGLARVLLSAAAGAAVGCGDGGTSPAVARELALEVRVAEGAQPDIYAMRADGSAPANLTRHPAGDWAPRWSPDGRFIAFLSDRGGADDVYVMRADGSGVRALTAGGGGYLFQPSWSPDGRRVAAARDDELGRSIYVLELGGGAPVRLAKSAFSVDDMPSWSPDGSRIAFRSSASGGPGGFAPLVHVMNADGSGRTAITPPEAGGVLGVAWSPDGRRIAAAAEAAGDVGRVLVVNADGTGLAALPQVTDAACCGLAWSPDGRRLVYGASDGHPTSAATRLEVAAADGAGVPQPLPPAGGAEFHAAPSWRGAP